MGFQTANSSTTKTFQVAKKVYVNSFTQVEDNLNDIKDKFLDKSNKYLTVPNLLNQVENFINKVTLRMEEALQSNETINIFKNDFDLDKFNHISTEDGKKKNANDEDEVRTFRDNSAGNKAKKEKSVNIIRGLAETDPFVTHSLYRNYTFDESIKVEGIPYTSEILFWNIKDVEQNAPIFSVKTPCEITCYEFSPVNNNYLVIALSSGQLIFIKFIDLMSTLREDQNTYVSSYMKHANIKDYYIYNI